LRPRRGEPGVPEPLRPRPGRATGCGGSAIAGPRPSPAAPQDARRALFGASGPALPEVPVARRPKAPDPRGRGGAPPQRTGAASSLHAAPGSSASPGRPPAAGCAGRSSGSRPLSNTSPNPAPVAAFAGPVRPPTGTPGNCEARREDGPPRREVRTADAPPEPAGPGAAPGRGRRRSASAVETRPRRSPSRSANRFPRSPAGGRSSGHLAVVVSPYPPPRKPACRPPYQHLGPQMARFTDRAQPGQNARLGEEVSKLGQRPRVQPFAVRERLCGGPGCQPGHDEVEPEPRRADGDVQQTGRRNEQAKGQDEY